MTHQSASYTLLSGGVGGAKLALGLDKILTSGQLRIIANTGDDFEHLGLPVCPDIDTLMYTLAGQANTETGWGLKGESWEFMAAVTALGGASWFSLGDADIGTHAQRLTLLRRGLTLTAATEQLCTAAGVATPILPMSDAPIRTYIRTEAEDIDFQNYFVRLKAEPVANGFIYKGHGQAPASTHALAALRRADLGAIILAPSNPWLSIDPILSLGDICEEIQQSSAPVIAISPVIGGNSVKGPTAKLMRELGLDVSSLAIAEHYREVIDGLIIDRQDAADVPRIEALGIKTAVTDTLMTTLADKTALASFTLDFAEQLAAET